MRNSVIAGAALMTWAALASGAAAQTDSGAAARGAYVFQAAGCFGCHTDVKGKGKLLAGGRALVTPFGTFYGPNITPDPEHGIGRWSREDFARALRTGISPAGRPYYPAFPFTSFTGMTDADVGDLWAYLRTVEPAPRANTPHKLKFPYGWRWLNDMWKVLYFSPRRFEAGAPPEGVTNTTAWRRGAYLVNAVGHCGECHSPRGALGAMRRDHLLAGNDAGAEGKPVPNITPDDKRGIGAWSAGDITMYLEIGMDPDGDFAGGAMAEVIKHTTSKLTPEDRTAIATYLKSVPPEGRIPTIASLRAPGES